MADNGSGKNNSQRKGVIEMHVLQQVGHFIDRLLADDPTNGRDHALQLPPHPDGTRARPFMFHPERRAH